MKGKQPASIEAELGSAPLMPLIAKYAIPSIISMLVGALYNLTDQVFIGRIVGVLGNAASNVVFPTTTLSQQPEARPPGLFVEARPVPDTAAHHSAEISRPTRHPLRQPDIGHIGVYRFRHDGFDQLQEIPVIKSPTHSEKNTFFLYLQLI